MRSYRIFYYYRQEATIASKIDYRTGAVTPILTAEELNSSVPELAKIAKYRCKSSLFRIF